LQKCTLRLNGLRLFPKTPASARLFGALANPATVRQINASLAVNRARRRVMAMKIDADVVGFGPQPEKDLALVQVTIEFERPNESMTMRVLVPNDADWEALTKRGIERAQSLARRFADCPTAQLAKH
jgi:hypothetical protein